MLIVYKFVVTKTVAIFYLLPNKTGRNLSGPTTELLLHYYDISLNLIFESMWVTFLKKIFINILLTSYLKSILRKIPKVKKISFAPFGNAICDRNPNFSRKYVTQKRHLS